MVSLFQASITIQFTSAWSLELDDFRAIDFSIKRAPTINTCKQNKINKSRENNLFS